MVYLGLRISAKGLQPVELKINAVKRAPARRNVDELRSFLVMVQYYHSFLPGLATTLAPLHKLLQKNVQWEWTIDCQKAFDACKEGLTSDSLLVHYDLNRKLRLACDARMQRWALILSAYDYQIEYRKSDEHSNCDALSRLPHEDSKIGSESEIYSVSAIDKNFPITAKDIGKATLLDPVLSRVFDLVMTGWPEKCVEENLKPYYTRRHELSCEQNRVLWGPRVIIPQVFRKKMLKELHWEHPGVCAKKAIAHTCV